MSAKDPSPMSLQQAIVSELEARQGEARELVISLTHDLPTFRRLAVAPGAETPKLTQEALLRGRDPRWRMATLFSRLLASGIERHARTEGIRNWGEAALPISAATIARFAQRLLEQLGCWDQRLLDYARRPPDFDALAASTAQTVDEAESMASRWSHAMAEAVVRRARSTALPSPPGLLSLHTEDSQSWVTWLDAAGELLWHEDLQTFVTSMTQGIERPYANDVARLRRAREELVIAGPRALREISPRLAELVEQARSQKPLALRLGTGMVRPGVPADVWLYLGARCIEDDGGACVLSVHRRHHEYILEGPGRSRPRYYFPPILLVARLMVSAARPVPSLWLPSVRQPANGYSWAHPYTGGMERSWTTDATMLTPDEPAQAEASPQAMALFPNLAQRVPVSMERSLCLRGQESTLAAINGRLHMELMKGATADVLSCITAVHDVARVGLTRAHHLNTSPPRLEMNDVNMIYPLRGHKVHGDLARRIFPYDQRTVMAVG